MENFNRLMNLVMSFSFGIRAYQEKHYLTLEDDIIDLVHSEEHITLRNKAIIELLTLEPALAFRFVKRFNDIIKEVERDFFKVRDYSSEYTVEQFDLVCSLRGVIVKRSAWKSDTIVTTNFINLLKNNIWARTFIVSQIEEALLSVLENKLPRQVSIFTEDGVIDNLPANSETDEWMDRNLWNRITSEGILIDRTRINEHQLVRNDFDSLLTEKGKVVFNDIKSYFKGARPVQIFAVFYAMADLDLISTEKKNLYKLTRQAVADALGVAFQTTLSTQIVGYNINIYERRSHKQQQRVLEAQNIINGFLN